MSDISNVTRELVLIKVKAPASVRNDIIQIAEVFRGRIIDISTETLTIEITGEEHKTTALMDMLKVYEILEVARTGKVALDRGMEYISYKDEE